MSISYSTLHKKVHSNRGGHSVKQTDRTELTDPELTNGSVSFGLRVENGLFNGYFWVTSVGFGCVV
jgi:hypothetical protein